MPFNYDAAKKAGYSDQEIQSYLNQQQTPANQGAFTNAIQKTGAFDIPVLGGLLRGVAQPAAQLGETAFDEGRGLMSLLTTGKKAQPMAMSPEEQQALISPQAKQSNPVMNALGYEAQQLPSQAGAVLTAEGASSLPGAASAAIKAPGNLLDFLSSLHPGVSGKAVGNAVASATKAGVTDSAPDVITEFKQAIEDKLGGPGGLMGDPGLQKSYGKMLQILTGRADMEPETLAKIHPSEFTGQFTPEQLVKGRQNLVTRFGYSPTDEGTLDQKVANIARDILSKRAKDITEGLSKADANFSRSMNLQETLQRSGPDILRALGIGAGAGGVGQIISALRSPASSSSQSQP